MAFPLLLSLTSLQRNLNLHQKAFKKKQNKTKNVTAKFLWRFLSKYQN